MEQSEAFPSSTEIEHAIEVIASRSIFDSAYYTDCYPDVFQANVDPLRHYATVGALELRRPNILFDPVFYLSSFSDAFSLPVNPLLHYIEVGAAEGRSPHPLFDADYYASLYGNFHVQGDFSPLEDFLACGLVDLKRPMELFDTTYYLRRHPDIAAMNMNPLVHFLLLGASELRKPHPLFDTSFYLDSYPDVEESGINPLIHFVTKGASELRNPSPLFDTAYFIEQYSRILEDNSNPLIFFLIHGLELALNPCQHFDTDFYLESYPQVRELEINPLLHYIHFGANEGLDPSPSFSTSFYARQYPGSRSANSNPLAHYLTIGRQLGYITKQLETDRESEEILGNSLVSELSRFVEPSIHYEAEKAIDSHDELAVRAIAFYLPQFHPIPENDLVWGKGFTEWTNVTKSFPRFPGHYQPRLPGELGFYDLRSVEVQRQQMELAARHGIEGFCYHYYWFSGKKVLNTPIENHLAEKSLKLRFCINWANESWTEKWDGRGAESRVIIDQEHSPEDDIRFIEDIARFMRDERYIRIEGRPLVLVYRPALFPNVKETVKRWKEHAAEIGIGAIYVAMVQSFESDDPIQYGMDGAVEFPPHNIRKTPYQPVQLFPGVTSPEIWSYEEIARESVNRGVPCYDWFRGVMLEWDNSARHHGSSSYVFQGCTADLYADWLERQCYYSLNQLPPEKRLVFINAWNEWAEGTYLEPDRHRGFSYINRTGEVLVSIGKVAISKRMQDFLSVRYGNDALAAYTEHAQTFALPSSPYQLEVPLPDRALVDEWILLLQSAISKCSDFDSSGPEVSIIVPVYNQIRFTLSCLLSLVAHSSLYSFEIILADDCSTDETHALGSIESEKLVYVKTPENLGFLGNCNYAAARASGEYIVLLNNDTVVLEDWLDCLISPLDVDDSVGLVGSKLLYPDGRLQEAGGVIFCDGSGMNYGNMGDPLAPEFNYLRDADYCSGASIALRKIIWDVLDGFDGSIYEKAYYEDTDLAFRIREHEALRVVYQPLSQIIHYEGISSGRNLSAGIKRYQNINRPQFFSRWREVLRNYGRASDSPDKYIDRTKEKRLLLVDWVTPLPDQDSGSADTFNYLKIFCALGFQVTFIPKQSQYMSRYTRDLQELGVQVLHDPFIGDFESILKKEVPKADVVFVYREVAHNHLRFIKELAGKAPVIFNTVDVHFLRLQREAELTEDPRKADFAEKTKELELAAIEGADATIVLSEFERDLVKTLLPNAHVALIPILREMPDWLSKRYELLNEVVFIGGFLHMPNVDAVKYFVSEIWPLVDKRSRQIKLVIAGSNVPNEIAELASSDIEIRGYVEDLSDLYANALISIAPLRFGAGLKGKVVSSLSYGCPTVGTSISFEGSGLEGGKHVMIADEPQSFADCISELIVNKSRWSKLAREGRKFCEEHYSVEAVHTSITDLLSSLDVL